ncbi:Fc.00g005000.m01.CDS01 [Cosmosporella sp. VM-42]
MEGIDFFEASVIRGVARKIADFGRTSIHAKTTQDIQPHGWVLNDHDESIVEMKSLQKKAHQASSSSCHDVR